MSDEKPNFLVVDDDLDTRNLMDAFLTSMGCTVKCVTNGEDALKELATAALANRFDAVFLDVMMPGLNGYEVSKRIKEAPHTAPLPVVMVTAKESYSDVLGGYTSGADYYINKPLTKAQITYALDMLLSPPESEKDDGYFLPEA